MTNKQRVQRKAGKGTGPARAPSLKPRLGRGCTPSGKDTWHSYSAALVLSGQTASPQQGKRD